MRIVFQFGTPAAVLTALLLATAPTAAQRVDPERVIDVNLEVGTQTVTAAIREGGSFKLTIERTDEYELVPVLAGESPQSVTFAVYRAVAEQPSTRRLVERIEIRIGASAQLRSNSQIRLTVDAVRKVALAETAATFRPVSFSRREAFRDVLQDDDCCVCCGNVCACGCGVSMSCGFCCMTETCCKIIRPAPSAALDAAAQFAAFFGTGCERGFRPGRREQVTALR